jgi:microcystin-dependent protein
VPITLDQIDTGALAEFIVKTMSEPSTIPDPNVVTGLPDHLTQLDGQIPVGGLMASVVPTVPDGFLLADGSAVTTAHSDLRDALLAAGAPHGMSGSDPKLPNLTDKVPVGAGGTFGFGGSGGEVNHTLTVTEMPSHQHQLQNNAGSAAGSTYGYQDRTGTEPNAVLTDFRGGGGAHNNMPPYVALYWMVKT